MEKNRGERKLKECEDMRKEWREIEGLKDKSLGKEGFGVKIEDFYWILKRKWFRLRRRRGKLRGKSNLGKKVRGNGFIMWREL